MSREIDQEMLRRADGHASDVALSALVDGQDDLVPSALCEHVDACPVCSERLGDLAALAFSIDEGLLALGAESSVAPARVPASSAAHRPFPAAAFALGLLVAALGSMPRWLGEGHVGSRLFGIEHEGFSLWRTARLFLPVVVERERAFFVAVCLTTTLLAALGGWLLARSSAELQKEPLA